MTMALTTDQKDPLISSSSTEKVVDVAQPVSNVVIEDIQIGVRKFRVARPRETAFWGLSNARAYVVNQLPILVRLATDIFKVSPHYALVFLLCKLWSSVEGTLAMYISNRLLQLVC
jgi:hypothetical protein